MLYFEITVAQLFGSWTRVVRLHTVPVAFHFVFTDTLYLHSIISVVY